mmetsp:Transcript_4945/g.7325  ORF Transcript_4945/g.7325 Transcript_4945/m.7325 type:complete len:82 (+) Transcript_4945:651-896(+)
MQWMAVRGIPPVKIAKLADRLAQKSGPDLKSRLTSQLLVGKAHILPCGLNLGKHGGNRFQLRLRNVSIPFHRIKKQIDFSR